jgi:hypothetical protein
MAVPANKKKGYYGYTDDTDVQWAVLIDANTATQGGFASADGLEDLPRGMTMRQVHGANTDGSKQRASMYVATRAAALYTDFAGTTFQNGAGQTFQPTSRIGEKRIDRAPTP